MILCAWGFYIILNTWGGGGGCFQAFMPPRWRHPVAWEITYVFVHSFEHVFFRFGAIVQLDWKMNWLDFLKLLRLVEAFKHKTVFEITSCSLSLSVCSGPLVLPLHDTCLLYWHKPTNMLKVSGNPCVMSFELDTWLNTHWIPHTNCSLLYDERCFKILVWKCICSLIKSFVELASLCVYSTLCDSWGM